MNRADLVITALQQRIGELVAAYETQIAIMRAEITELVDQKNEREKAEEEYSKELDAKLDAIG